MFGWLVKVFFRKSFQKVPTPMNFFRLSLNTAQFIFRLWLILLGVESLKNKKRKFARILSTCYIRWINMLIWMRAFSTEWPDCKSLAWLWATVAFIALNSGLDEIKKSLIKELQPRDQIQEILSVYIWNSFKTECPGKFIACGWPKAKNPKSKRGTRVITDKTWKTTKKRLKGDRDEVGSVLW